jgi:flagellar hook-associated protein 1
MGDITQALRTAQSGLLVNQQALNTVSNNISNVNTPGYSKKVINFENVAIAGVPAGVKISSVVRKVDEGLLKTLRIENGELNTFTGKQDALDRLQELFGAPGENSSVSHMIESFGEAAELLALNPDKSMEPAEFVRRAQDVIGRLQGMSESIQDQRLQADQKISDIVAQINSATGKIDQLNDDIISSSTVGRDVTDLRDQRDIELDKLSKLVDIRYFSRTDGDVVVFTSAGRTLVDTVPPVVSHTAASGLTATSTHAQGEIGPIYVGDKIAGNDITNEVREGLLKAQIELRDEILPNLQGQLDGLAAKLRDTVNSVHNRSVSFPGVQSMSGTRQFIGGSTQTMTLGAAGGTDDVKILLFDSNGNQSAVTSLNTIMQTNTFTDSNGAVVTSGSAQVSKGPWTISEVASHLDGWLKANASPTATATLNSESKLQIDLNTTSLNLVFRDESAAANGSTAADATIRFDSNGDGNNDETVSGFSSFFGLNDFFVDNIVDNLYESNVIEKTYATTAATLTFHDASTIGTTGSLSGTSSLTVAQGTSITDLATQITNNVTNLTASVIPDGAGARLRITHSSGASFTVTQSSTDTLLTDIGMHVGDVRMASSLSVRSDIVDEPGKTTTGMAQFDTNLGPSGEYLMSVADNTVANQMAMAFSTTTTFELTGGLSKLTQTFSQYSAEILSNNANIVGVNERNAETQNSLSEALQFKSDSLRGVNLDEEMADLIVFEQSFAAAARVISVIQNMMETLERAIS